MRSLVQAADIVANTVVTDGKPHNALYGYSIREANTVAAATTVTFRDGSATGQILAVVELTADSSRAEFFDVGVSAPGGVYVQVAVGGVIEGVVYIS